MSYPYYYSTMPNFNIYGPLMTPQTAGAVPLASAATSTPDWTQPVAAYRLNSRQTKALQENALKGMRADEGSMAGTIGSASLWAVPSVAANIKPKADKATTEFLKLQEDNLTLKYASLFENNPTLTTETMQASKKLQKKFARDIKRLKRAGMKTDALSTDLANINEKLIKALESGNVNEIAKVKAEIEAANSVKNGAVRRISRKLKGKNTIKSRTAMARKSTMGKAGQNITVPKEGKIFSRAGVGGAGIMFAITMATETGKIKEAYQYDRKTGNKQLRQSAGKAGISSAFYVTGETLGRKAVTKYVVPKMAKFAAKKIVSAGAGKAIGGAIGSCIPVVGTAVGIIVGCVFDFAFKKWISPLIFGKDEPLAQAQATSMSAEDLLNNAIENCSMGQKLDNDSMRAIRNYYNANDKMEEYYELRKLNKKVSQMSKKEFKQYQKALTAQQMQAQQESQAQSTAA